MSPSTNAKQAYTLNINPFFNDLNTKLLLFTLQGIVNQTGPRLFYDGRGVVDRDWAERKWMEVYAEWKNFSFQDTGTIEELIRVFSADIRGLVVYDPALDASRYIAVTLGGLNGWLPVAPEMIDGVIANFPVKEDLRGRWSSQTEAYEWAMDELLPLCTRGFAHNAGQSHDDVEMGTDLSVLTALDYSVSKKAFVFNLSPSAEPGVYGWDKLPIAASPEDARLMREILNRLDPLTQVWGWAEPEWTMTSTLSQHEHFLMCGSAINLSFHAMVPAEQKTYKQPCRKIPTISKPENKHYLAFMTTEGDAPRVYTTFFFGGWINEDRGKIPVNWGVNPILLHDFPVFAEYYFSTATENDYFFAGCSGTAYAFIDRLPSVEDFAKLGKPYFEQFDVTAVDSWDEFEFFPERYEAYANIIGATIFTLLPRGATRIEILPSGVPVLIPHEAVNYKGCDVEKTPQAILKIAEENPSPFLIPCYVGVDDEGATKYLEIMKKLRETFQAVTLEDMAEMAKELQRDS